MRDQSSTVDQLLSRLDKVRQTRPDRWIARCSAHDDHTPSLAIRACPDGRILIHCFAGCSVEEILSAAGLTFEALFPERPVNHHVKREHRPFNAFDVLACCEFEALVVASAASNMLTEGPLSEVDRERLFLAVERLVNAVELSRGR